MREFQWRESVPLYEAASALIYSISVCKVACVSSRPTIQD